MTSSSLWTSLLRLDSSPRTVGPWNSGTMPAAQPASCTGHLLQPMREAVLGDLTTPWFSPVTLPLIKRPLARLLRRFSPTLARLDEDGIHVLPSDGAGTLRLLVGRSLCLYLHVDASAVPARERAGFVMLAVRRAAPFDDPEVDVAWMGDHAAAWFWSASRVRQLAGTLPSRTRIHAEASHRGAVPEAPDQLELLDLSYPPHEGSFGKAGFEARVWRGGQLVATRWWAALPAEGSWMTFLRGAGLPPLTTCPAPTFALMRDQPFGPQSQGAALGRHLHAQWPTLATALAGVIAGVFCWQLAGIARAYVENNKTETRISQLEKRLDTVITARNAADESARTIDELLQLRPPASQSRLLAQVSNAIPAGDWAIVQWQQPSPEILEITLKGTGLDAPAIVNAMEQSPLLQDVTPITSNRGDELTLQAKLAPASWRTP